MERVLNMEDVDFKALEEHFRTLNRKEQIEYMNSVTKTAIKHMNFMYKLSSIYIQPKPR